MADFGKLDFSVSFNPTSAFPLDARCYFDSLVKAKAAAASAKPVGSTTSKYYYGMQLLVNDGHSARWYTIQEDGTLCDSNAGSLYIFDPYAEGAVADYDPGIVDDREIHQKPYVIDKAVTLPKGRYLNSGDLLLTSTGGIYRVTTLSSGGVGAPPTTFNVTHVFNLNIDGWDGELPKDGKSAYQYAVEGGYTGSEEAFSSALAKLGVTPHAKVFYYNPEAKKHNLIVPGSGTSRPYQKLDEAVPLSYRPSGFNVENGDLLVTSNGDFYRVFHVLNVATVLYIYAVPEFSIEGIDGKSAYQYAVEGGYTGSEEEFGTKLAELINHTEGDDSGDDGYVDGDVGTSNPTHNTGTQKAVLYTAQNLTDEEKAQARTNIGALSETDISESLLQRLVAQQFDKFVVIGRDEPDHSSCIWFDTNITAPVYLLLDGYTEDAIISTEINRTEYSILNTDNPVLADDGTVILNVGEHNFY